MTPILVVGTNVPLAPDEPRRTAVVPDPNLGSVTSGQFDNKPSFLDDQGGPTSTRGALSKTFARECPGEGMAKSGKTLGAPIVDNVLRSEPGRRIEASGSAGSDHHGRQRAEWPRGAGAKGWRDHDDANEHGPKFTIHGSLERIRDSLGHGPLTPRALQTEVPDCPPLEVVLSRLDDVSVDRTGRLVLTRRTPTKRAADADASLGIAAQPGGWAPLPDWAAYFSEVGRIAANLQGDWLWVISTPTRAYAAALVAAGTVITRAGGGSADDPESWFASLAKLAAGTPVTVRSGEKLIRAVFRGTTNESGGDYVSLQDKKHNRWLMPVAQCLRITPASGALPTFGSVHVGDRRFLQNLLVDVDPLDFLRRSKLHCLVCGGVNDFRAETMDPAFASRRGAKIERGRLQSIVRTARLVGARGHYRSEIVGAGEAGTSRLGRPDLVIHNGSDAFIRRRRFDGVPQVVLLGRADRQFDVAMGLSLTAYAQRNLSTERPRLPDPPASSDQLLFVWS